LHALARAERLSHLIFGAGLKADDAIDLFVAGRKKDDRSTAQGTQRTQKPSV
jgi:hypothetical protein